MDVFLVPAVVNLGFVLAVYFAESKRRPLGLVLAIGIPLLAIVLYVATGHDDTSISPIPLVVVSTAIALTIWVPGAVVAVVAARSTGVRRWWLALLASLLGLALGAGTVIIALALNCSLINNCL